MSAIYLSKEVKEFFNFVGEREGTSAVNAIRKEYGFEIDDGRFDEKDGSVYLPDELVKELKRQAKARMFNSVNKFLMEEHGIPYDQKIDVEDFSVGECHRFTFGSLSGAERFRKKIRDFEKTAGRTHFFQRIKTSGKLEWTETITRIT